MNYPRYVKVYIVVDYFTVTVGDHKTLLTVGSR